MDQKKMELEDAHTKIEALQLALAEAESIDNSVIGGNLRYLLFLINYKNQTHRLVQ